MSPNPSPRSSHVESALTHLDRILESASFRNSQRLSRFLRFIVERTLDDARDELKESVVGIMVFDRPAGYDPKLDSIVRVQARQLRGKLEDYYAGPGRNDTVRFEIPKGSYAPVIRTEAAEEPPKLFAIDKPPSPAAAADIAVLPFVNFSADPDNEYFSDGITEEILGALAQVRGLRLIARTSSFQFKGRNLDIREVAKKLGARTILEGSVRRAGNQLRVTAQWIDGSDGTHLWSGNFDACLTEPAQIFAIQENIAREISLHLGKAVSPAERSSTAGQPISVAAYEKCLRARKLMRELRPESIMAAIPLLEAAIAEDPGYAAAYATLAGCYGHLGVYGGIAGVGALPKARFYAEEAVRRDPLLADGHTLLGNVAAALDLDVPTARRHFDRALELDPQNAYARQARALWLLGPTGETAAACEEVERLLLLDALSIDLRHTYMTLLMFARRFEEAVAQATLILQFAPQSHAAYFVRWLSYEALGEDEKANQDLKGNADYLPNLMIDDHYAAVQLIRAGRHEEAVAAAKRMEQDPRAPFVATVLADLWIRLGDYDRAIDWLERAYEMRIFRILWLGVDLSYDKIRHLPRFQALRDKVLGAAN